MVQRTRNVRFRRPDAPAALASRLPPGQFFTPRWPVLHQGEIPVFDSAEWNFRVWGLVANPLDFSWDQFSDLPISSVRGDLHCVTRWSTLDHDWQGVAPIALSALAGVDAAARFVLLQGESGYTANLPLDAFLDKGVVLATHHNGEPLAPAHGAPLRAVVPGRYAWKSVKWLRGIEFLAEDRAGFWESFGYSNSADPWLEERFES